MVVETAGLPSTSRAPTTTLQRRRSFVTSVAPTIDPPDAVELAAMSSSQRERYDEQRISLYYLRARYYDPTTAQFINIDPLAIATKAIYTYADNNPLNASDPLGLWSWNPFEWTGQEWDSVGAVAGAVALAAAVVGVTVATGGTAALVIGAIGWTAAATSTAISGVGAYNDCTRAIDENCAFSVGGTVIGLSGFRLGRFMSKTAWTSMHVSESGRAGARAAWGAANFLGPAFDALNYERKYC